MPIVEMVGARCVGKTTLADAVLALPRFRGWQSREVLEAETSFVPPGSIPSSPPHATLLDMKMRDKLRFEPSLAENENFRNYVGKLVEIDIILRRQRGGGSALLSELLLHHFSQQILVLASEMPDLVRSLSEGRNVVFVLGSPDEVVRNIRKRQQFAEIDDFMPHATDEKLRSVCASHQIHLANLMDCVEQHGARCLTVDMRAGLSACVAETTAFLDELAHGSD
jgi:hypothetical protein